MGAQLTVGLLGPIAVTGPDGPVTVEGAKRKALIAMLALAVPRPVSADRLIDELWGDEPPAKPANVLQAQISQVRSLLGRDLVVRAGNGYALAVEPSAVDALELERLVAEGRAGTETGESARALAAFRDAVGLLRGPALSDVVDVDAARAAAVRLDALALDAQEGLAAAELALGNHEDVVPSLTALVGAHPLRERLHSLLILALYRCGRQAEALRAYQTARTVLLDELGVDPGPELQALERAVLAQDPALRSPIEVIPADSPTLPTSLTSFVGRAEEVAAVADALTTERLVTIVAVGGMGKTRVAMEVAHRLPADQDVRFVELAPVTDPVAVPEAIAVGVGAGDQSSPNPSDRLPPDDRVVDRLGDRDVVLVLDNAEHVLTAVVGSVTTLLRGCPRLRILVTSRQALGIAGERPFELGPMGGEDAAHLFAERARQVQPRFGDVVDAELVDLCARLDHLPLAIELAAARTKTLPLGEITERLANRFDLLRAAGWVGEGGHEGLRAAVDWSYESLFDDERRVFCRLAVFAGGATSQAVEDVWGPDALDLVERLVDKALVVADTSTTPVRFHMLETLRAYGVDRLRDEGELDAAQAAHLAWCTALAAAAEPHMRRREQIDWLPLIDVEHDNLRAALAHASSSDPVGGLALIGHLILPWYFRGRLQEARHWAEACLDRAVDAPVELRAKVLAWIGLLSDAGTWTGQPGGIEAELALAEARAREAIDLLGPDGDPFRVAEAHRMLAIALSRRASAGAAIDPEEFTRLLEETIERFLALDEPYGAAMLYGILGMVTLVQGDVEGARHAAEWSRALAERAGDRFGLSRAVWLAGIVAEATGDPGAAYDHIEHGVRLLGELGMETHVTAEASLLARLADRNDQPALAAQWREFLAERGGERPAGDDIATEALGRNREGLARRAQGRLDKARAAHLEALRRYRDAGIAGGTAFTESCLGFLASHAGDGDVAREHHLAALSAAVDAAEPGALALALEGVATVAADGGDVRRAAVLLGAGASRWERSDGARDPILAADVDEVVDRVRSALGPAAHDAATAEGQAMDDLALVVLAREAAHGG